MKKRKIPTLIIIFILVVAIALLPIILVFSANLFAWSSILVGGWLSPNPPKPKITYAEFPYEIVYELDGEIITSKDVYVCEFDGFGWNEGVGKYREWKGYIKSSGKEEFILLEDDGLKLVCSLGFPEYYMSDPQYNEYYMDDSDIEREEFIPYIYYIKSEFGGTTTGINDIESLLEKYELNLVSWKLSEPIQNSFE